MLDILFFAVLAVIIFGRLWQVMGQKDEDGAPRRKTPRPAGDDEDDVVVLSDKARELLPPPQVAVIAPLSLAGTLGRMTEKDPAFDEKSFIDGARGAFQMIVAAFAKGDIAPVSFFLAPDVEKMFRDAIAARVEKGQTLEHTLHEIKEISIDAASLEDTKAWLRVHFVSVQTNKLSGESTVAEGPEEIEDMWTFARDMASPNPNWKLVETRS